MAALKDLQYSVQHLLGFWDLVGTLKLLQQIGKTRSIVWVRLLSESLDSSLTRFYQSLQVLILGLLELRIPEEGGNIVSHLHGESSYR